MEAHQLPKDCYPPTDSDDSDFEVLGTDSEQWRAKEEEQLNQELKSQLLPSQSIDNALDMANDAMLSAMTLQSLPQVPQELQMNDSMMSSCSASTISTKMLLELQDKVNDLKQENIQLKTTLEQQNIVSRTHSEVLASWNENVLRVQESHKQKFIKMKALIEHLKKENLQLKGMLITAQSKSQSDLMQNLESVEVGPNLDQKLKDLQDKHDKELQQLSSELQLLKDQLEQKNVMYNDSCAELQRAKDDLEKQKQDSTVFVQQSEARSVADQKILDELVLAMDEDHKQTAEKYKQERMLLELQLEDLKIAHTEEVKNLEDKLQLEIIALQQQLSGNQQQAQSALQMALDKTKDDLKSISGELGDSLEINEQQILRINDLKAKLTDLSNVHDLKCMDLVNVKQQLVEVRAMLVERDDEIMKTQEQLCAAKNEIIAMRAAVEANAYLEEQLADYKKQVTVNDDAYRRMEIETQEAAKKEQTLQKDNAALKCQLMKIRNEETAELQRLRIQLSEAQNTIVELKEAKKIVESEAAKNREAVDEIDGRYKAARCDQDKLVALEEQLKVYHHDFKSERENKLFVTDELNRVSHDLQNVQMRNRELIEEIERLRMTQDFVNVPSQASAPKTNTPSPPLTRYPCPLCTTNFRSLRQLEDHVELCINNSAMN